MPAKVFDPRDITLVVGGHVVTGYADDTFVSVEWPDQGSHSVGADGEVALNNSPDRTATLTITLKQTSLSNDVLSTLVKAAKATNTPISPVLITGPGGRTLISAVHAWPANKPNVTYGREAGEFEWRFILVDVEDTIGGIDAA